jgi:hypothetical protein
MTIINHYPLGKYSKNPKEVIGRKYNDKIIIYIMLKISHIVDGVWGDSYKATYYLYTITGQVYTSNTLSTDLEQTAINYCKQTNLPYSYD